MGSAIDSLLILQMLEKLKLLHDFRRLRLLKSMARSSPGALRGHQRRNASTRDWSNQANVRCKSGNDNHSKAISTGFHESCVSSCTCPEVQGSFAAKADQVTYQFQVPSTSSAEPGLENGNSATTTVKGNELLELNVQNPYCWCGCIPAILNPS